METFVKVLLACLIASESIAAQERRNATLRRNPEDCRDSISSQYCQMLRRNGACVSGVKRMMQLCRKTCHFCKEDCKDFLPAWCPWWQAHYACYTHPQILHKYCRKSCGRCSVAAAPPKPKCASSKFGCCWDRKTEKGPNGECPECKDWLRLCRWFIKDCYYGNNRKFMLTNCPRTCRRCF